MSDAEVCVWCEDEKPTKHYMLDCRNYFNMSISRLQKHKKIDVASTLQNLFGKDDFDLIKKITICFTICNIVTENIKNTNKMKAL